jgi:hypothetical protein
MKPSHVRERILQDHELLRLRLGELEAAVCTMQVDYASETKVAELVGELMVALTHHTELEDEILAPALLEIDAWGAERSQQLLAHHSSQRAELQGLRRLFSMHLDHDHIARVVMSLIRDLRKDMEHEEQDILSVDLLRDDVIAVEGVSG